MTLNPAKSLLMKILLKTVQAVKTSRHQHRPYNQQIGAQKQILRIPIQIQRTLLIP